MLNFLANSGTLGYGVKVIPDIPLNWIGQIIMGLIGGIGIVGLGIIVFTIILKTIVLPLDIYSRIKTKKQALIMERMRPQMEKLQKQYANDKNMYNQKVMELQKKSGYSMFGACLPMIVSLVIFIIVFQAFSAYSQFANLDSYNKMVGVYNGVVQSYVIDVTDEYGEALDGDDYHHADGFLTEVILNTPKKSDNPEEDVKAEKDYKVDYVKFATKYDPLLSEDEVFTKLAKEYKEAHTSYDGAFAVSAVNLRDSSGELTVTAVELRNTLVNYWLEVPAAQRVYEYYTGTGAYEGQPHNNGFLWVHNVWYPDSTLNTEIPDFAKFKGTVTQANIGDDYMESYNKVTANLTDQKGQVNGYFILIVLSIGFMLLQQFLSMRANKSVNDLSTVDGSGAKTNKWMMILMPIIYGVFSFFYSASFSLYMITNTLYGLVTMLIINKCVDVWFKKKEASGELEEILNKAAKKREAKEKRRAAKMKAAKR